MGCNRFLTHLFQFIIHKHLPTLYSRCGSKIILSKTRNKHYSVSFNLINSAVCIGRQITYKSINKLCHRARRLWGHGVISSFNAIFRTLKVLWERNRNESNWSIIITYSREQSNICFPVDSVELCWHTSQSQIITLTTLQKCTNNRVVYSHFQKLHNPVNIQESLNSKSNSKEIEQNEFSSKLPFCPTNKTLETG